MKSRGTPHVRGLYNPKNEHDSCGIGFVAQLNGKKSHKIVKRGVEVLENMDHRGAKSSDNSTGDGAGILIQIPHKFFLHSHINLPEEGKYGAGILFLPKNGHAQHCINTLNYFIEQEGLELIGYRDVPVESSILGQIAKSYEPAMKQVFIKGELEQEALERKLYLVRKQTEQRVWNSDIIGREQFYLVSLSSKILIYKGMLSPLQLKDYFPDLADAKLESSIALVHSRFSTNTFPNWQLAQPFRMIAHNGEINTIKGNRLWMHAREAIMQTELFGDDLQKAFPIIESGMSDSASFDNALEFFHITGRTIPHALCMLIPESWNEKNPIPDSLKAFYEYHSTLMEPWDGPASIVFTDGRYIGGTLDRNGLRPSRYVITKDDLIVMGSEVGVQDFPPETIKEKGRLRPGKILLVDTKFGIIIPDSEVKAQLTQRNPYENWLNENRLELEKIPKKEHVFSALGKKYDEYLKLFNYSKEDIDFIIKYMVENKQEPTGSMGNDTPMAVLSQKPQRFFNYFRQLFAQVTNPPIDPLRESLVMSLDNYIGSVQKNILKESVEHCKLIKFKSPILTNTDLGKIKDLVHEAFTHCTLPIIFPVKQGQKGLEKALKQLLAKAEKAVDNKKNYIILSDKKVSREFAPIPVLLAVSAVNHHLIQKKKRAQVGIVVESGDAREVNDFAQLIAFGASVINPYVAFGIINKLVEKGAVKYDYQIARENYIKAINKGLLKIMSKMGISTLNSYFGSQNFEAIGISDEVINRHFTDISSQIGGIGFKEIAMEVLENHKKSYHQIPFEEKIASEGIYAFRKYGEQHSWVPESIALLQWATRNNDYEKYKEYAQWVNDHTRKPHFLRGMFDYHKNPIDINEVEPVEEIVKRFCTGAMSYGSISKEAHEALAIAMNALGGRSNTGEGGESEERFATSARSSIKQIASGRFGVTNSYLVNADELQIKMAQGAKPGEGGQLPGYKVNKIIARLRNSTPGITLISPPPHHDIYSIEDLAQLIYDLKCTNPQAKVSVKLVAENGVGTVAAGVAKANADIIVISGTEGGTGASPASSIKHAGIPWELGLSEAQQTLVMNNLRGRVRLQTDGQLKTGMDVVYAAVLGAEEFGFATSALITLGCVMMRKCHLNTCPAGIATQNKKLRKRFRGRSEWVINYFRFVAQEVREIMAEMGIRRFDELVGRADLLYQRKDFKHPKLNALDLSKVNYIPWEAKKYPIYNVNKNTRGVGRVLDHALIKLSGEAIEKRQKIWIAKNIKNTDRTVGAMLSGEITKRHGANILKKNTINCKFTGSAGQSFGAFAVFGVSLRLEGDANDYLGKGLSGAKIVIVPSPNSTFKPEENIIVGNTSLYGATSGFVYIRGIAGERFCVRNSGAHAVVEGVGDHCCEYMTGGRTVVLGKTGRNFAAGMSGGIAYVLDFEGDFDYYCNKKLVSLEKLENTADINELQFLINKHLLHTNSEIASKILTNWKKYLPKFVKVIPFEYKKVLQEEKLRVIKQQLQTTREETFHHE